MKNASFENKYNYSDNYASLIPYFNSLSILLLILFFMGIVLNLVSIKIILKNKRFKPINLLILNLASADLVYISGIPLFVVHVFSQSWPFKLIGCQLFFLTDFMGMIVGVYSVVALSIERFYEVVDKKKRVKMLSNQFKLLVMTIFLITLWIVSFLFSLPMVTSIKLTQTNVNTSYVCDTDWSNFNVNLYFSIKFVFIFIVPMLLILYSSLKLLVFLKTWRRMSERKLLHFSSRNTTTRSQQTDGMNSSDRLAETSFNLISRTGPILRPIQLGRRFRSLSINHRATKIVLSIDLFFFIQWTPLWFAELIKAISLGDLLDTHVHLFNLIATIFSYSNSIINPILYMILTHSFRSFISDLFPFKCFKNVF